MPFGESDLRTATAATDVTGAPLALYLVDNWNCRPSWELDFGLREALEEALEKCRLCMAPSEKLRAFYQKQYVRKVWLLPPVFPEQADAAAAKLSSSDRPLHGIILGHLNGHEDLRSLRAMISQTGLRFTWFRPPEEALLPESADLAKDRITLESDLSEERLIQGARDADFALILDDQITSEKSPSRFPDLGPLSNLIFVLSSAALPIILIGPEGSETSRLLEALDLGATINLGDGNLETLLTKLNSLSVRQKNVERAKELAPIFSSRRAIKLLWSSLERGVLTDEWFEKLFEPIRDRLTPYIDVEAPREILGELGPHYHALVRLRAASYKPSFILDVGASTGYWSYVAHQIFPEARFYLIDPLIERYIEKEGWLYRSHPEFTRIAAAAGDRAGEIVLHVSPDLYGSSLFDSTTSSHDDHLEPITLTVPLRTIDEIAQTEKIEGTGLLKIDAQFSEHLVLEEASSFLNQVDFILIELSLRRFTPEVKILDEFISYLKQKGFTYYDFAGDWRDSVTGELLQHDVIFRRSNN